MNYYPKHYCGVFGVYGHPNAAELTYYGLYALQHRGQESAGIVTSDGKQFHAHKGMGLVSQVFNGDVLHDMVGSIAIGHTRYSTTGSSHLRNAQPLTVDCARGQIAIAHNGNLTNAAQLREELEAKGSIFQTTVDSEIILHLLAQPTRNGAGQQPRADPSPHRGRLLAGHHDRERADRRARPARVPAAVPGPDRRRLGAGQRNLRVGPDPRQVRARRRAGRDRGHQPGRADQHAGVPGTQAPRVLHLRIRLFRPARQHHRQPQRL